LREQLHRIETELVHTDKRDLQREIAGDAAQLRQLMTRLGVQEM
jgi:hypothetical protein